jgi:hypothetical protein
MKGENLVLYWLVFKLVVDTITVCFLVGKFR